MTPAARLSAAIELIDAIDTQRVPAAKVLKEWGTPHRYAGSGDRAPISGLVWDAPRPPLTGMRRLERAKDVESIAALRDAGRFAPQPLSESERAALASRTLDG